MKYLTSLFLLALFSVMMMQRLVLAQKQEDNDSYDEDGEEEEDDYNRYSTPTPSWSNNNYPNGDYQPTPSYGSYPNYNSPSMSANSWGPGPSNYNPQPNDNNNNRGSVSDAGRHSMPSNNHYSSASHVQASWTGLMLCAIFMLYHVL